ncbi:MAG: tetratricopeptide repeat protein [Candidatus Eremiobacteraeota bacterium]|nr:tetratricopeptide repeat protein [Candidatus Eremiobacteraeota bacterium]
MHCPNCSKPIRQGVRFCIHCGYDLSTTPGFFSSPTLPVSFVLEKRYRVIQYITSGGMAHIYKVEDSRLKNVYCLKEMMDNYRLPEEKKEAVHRFIREAEILARLKHPSIPRIIDHFIENGRYYLVMEYIEGDDLETLLSRQPDGRFNWDRVTSWLRQILDMLGYIHNMTPPLIYRDMKPSNMLLGDDEQIYLVDFGIARVFAPRKKGTLIGTPGYASPEQYKGQVDIRSDIYSLGASLHHMVTGKDPREDVPFNFPPVKILNPDIDTHLSSIIDKALSYKMEERFASIEEMRNALNGGNSSFEAKKLYKIGLSYLKSGKYPESEVAFTKALGHNPDDAGIYLNRGVARERMNKNDEAIADFIEAETRQPDNPDAIYNLGCALKSAGDLDRAAARLERVIKLAPDHTSAYNNLGNIYYTREQWDMAIEMYERAIAIDPGFTLAMQNLKKARRKKRTHQRIKKFDQSARFDSDPARAFYNLGMYFLEWGRFDEAQAEFQKALRLGTDDADPFEGLGLVYYRKKDYREAARNLEKALKVDPGIIKLYGPLGRCYLKTGRKREAQACVEAGMERIMYSDENWRQDDEFLALRTRLEEITGETVNITKWEKERKKKSGSRNIKDVILNFIKGTSKLKFD